MITYLEAIREAQHKALSDDPRVYIYGQDVGAFGGAFKATKGLAKEFPGRVLDAPLSEDAIIGSAIGARSRGCVRSLKCSSQIFRPADSTRS
jgi:pyruvate dehydrogenase E1 component beta subunit/2-oxoisovalerate dehydrogenase E1 component beta subunit